MRKYILVLIILMAAVVPFFIFKNRYCPLSRSLTEKVDRGKTTCTIDIKTYQDDLLKYLKFRKDKLALREIEKILLVVPDDICALWAKAEVLRRAYKFKESEALLNQVLSKCPGHASSLISMSYIKYHDYEFKDALSLLKQALRQPALERENKALVYMLMGSINAKRSSLGGFFSKLAYGSRVKGFFEEAKILAPDLSEVHLGLGSFYLLAPAIAGGNIDRAIAELEYTVELTPDFATANVRLAQAYQKKGNAERYNFYLQRTKELDPENEVLKELDTD